MIIEIKLIYSLISTLKYCWDIHYERKRLPSFDWEIAVYILQEYKVDIFIYRKYKYKKMIL